MVLLPSLRWGPTVSSLGIIQWDFTRRDHSGNMGRVSGSGPVKNLLNLIEVIILYCLLISMHVPLDRKKSFYSFLKFTGPKSSTANFVLNFKNLHPIT